MMHAKTHTKTHARGAALTITLLMLVVLLLLGIAALRISSQSEHIARNRQDRQIAWQAAAAALRDAEYDIGAPLAPRYLLFGNPLSNGTPPCSKHGATAGICLAGDPRASATRWQLSNTPSLAYGRFSGQGMQTGSGAQSALPPRYLIEILPNTAGETSWRYRISALGFGPDSQIQVLLQSIYLRNDHPMRSERLSWREVTHTLTHQVPP